MKPKLLTGVSLGAILLAGGAQAADLGVRPIYKAPPMAPVAWSWTGFYVGGNIGGVFNDSSVADDPTSFAPWLTFSSANPTGNNGSGVIGGLEVGYNWQMASLVLGIEADISASSLNHTQSITILPSHAQDAYNIKLNWLSTVRGRVGWAFGRTLFYGTGGVAFADLADQLVDPPPPHDIGFVASTGSDVTGWTAGGGVEYALADHWTVKAEYLHVGFSDRTATAINTGYAFRFKDSLDIGRVGINYKF